MYWILIIVATICDTAFSSLCPDSKVIRFCDTQSLKRREVFLEFPKELRQYGHCRCNISLARKSNTNIEVSFLNGSFMGIAHLQFLYRHDDIRIMTPANGTVKLQLYPLDNNLDVPIQLNGTLDKNDEACLKIKGRKNKTIITIKCSIRQSEARTEGTSNDKVRQPPLSTAALTSRKDKLDTHHEANENKRNNQITNTTLSFVATLSTSPSQPLLPFSSTFPLLSSTKTMSSANTLASITTIVATYTSTIPTIQRPIGNNESTRMVSMLSHASVSSLNPTSSNVEDKTTTVMETPVSNLTETSIVTTATASIPNRWNFKDIQLPLITGILGGINVILIVVGIIIKCRRSGRTEDVAISGNPGTAPGNHKQQQSTMSENHSNEPVHANRYATIRTTSTDMINKLRGTEETGLHYDYTVLPFVSSVVGGHGASNVSVAGRREGSTVAASFYPDCVQTLPRDNNSGCACIPDSAMTDGRDAPGSSLLPAREKHYYNCAPNLPRDKASACVKNTYNQDRSNNPCGIYTNALYSEPTNECKPGTIMSGHLNNSQVPSSSKVQPSDCHVYDKICNSLCTRPKMANLEANTYSKLKL